ncbi:MAG: carboxypeptidase regulatory-like domain-containing protein [Pirellulaceae bacterium]|nr:carboxypeptidase regulatory-like domain-containing protein [Pirellulaceae bacterium]
MNRIAKVASFILVGSMLLVLAGCGGDSVSLGEVTGIVTVDGQPVGGLEVRFNPVGDAGGTSLGYTKADGSYQLFYGGGGNGAVLGSHTVSVTAAETDGEGAPVQIPARYNVQSELTFDVKAGKNTFNIEITKQ